MHQQLELLLRAQYGRRSERTKVPGVEKTARKQGDKPAPRKPKTPIDAHALPSETVEHAVPDEARHCTVCGGSDFVPLGAGEISNELEYLPGRLIQRRHVRQKLACRCGACVVTAPAPPRVAPGVVYGPALHAHVVAARCADSIPLSRLAERFKRDGLPIARSTVIELFHRSAEALKPLHAAVMAAVRRSMYVRADETPLPVLAPDKTRRAYMWVFGTDKLTAFLYRPTRSGQAAVDALGQTPGTLQVDGYTGYNAVTTPAGRTLVGCWAHARRKFYEARTSAPEEIDAVLRLIHGLYLIEIDARDQGIAFTEEHARLRRERAPALLEQLHAAVLRLKNEFPPKSDIATAASYTLKQWTELSRFVGDVRLTLDNNAAERDLRRIALGRKNSLFVGHDEGGENLAVLQTLVTSCLQNGINPEQYLADVLIRVQTWPNRQIAELLPDRWKPPDGG
jgi:transposase